MWPDLINEGASLLLKFDFLISFNLIVQLTFVTNLFGCYDIETNLVRSNQGSNSQNIYMLPSHVKLPFYHYVKSNAICKIRCLRIDLKSIIYIII